MVSVDDDLTGLVNVACSVGCGLVISDDNNCRPAKQYTISTLDNTKWIIIIIFSRILYLQLKVSEYLIHKYNIK